MLLLMKVLDITDLLEEIQNYILYNGHTCNFTKQCGDENWEYAYGIADRRIKELLKDTRLFQDFVERVSRPIKRQNKINTVLNETV